MIQFNLSLFVDPTIEEDAILAIRKIIIPELNKFEFINQIYLLEINSHQEPDSKGYSLQCWVHEESQEDTTDSIEQIVSAFFTAEFPNKYVYFPSKLTFIHSNQ
ncbi:MAG: hypothetical protein RJA76_605 [Bacteroidota bacterium]|jgi:hypothetical protein